MVVERFAPGRISEVYQVLRTRERMLPDGLVYIDSWVTASLDVCYQLMECEDPLLFQEWAARWGDLADIEIHPVASSAATTALFARLDAEAPYRFRCPTGIPAASVDGSVPITSLCRGAAPPVDENGPECW
jgi:hypothetical protein